MSVTFTCDAKVAIYVVEVPCLCAQMAPGYPSIERAIAAANADPNCWDCRGTGMAEERRSALDAVTVNASNMNARGLLAALRFYNVELVGAATLPAFRRALLLAQNTSLAHATRPTERYARQGDVARMCVVPGLDEARLHDYLRRLEALVDFALKHGASEIYWA